ncbi:MAG: phosphate butyryltransferase [Lachnospiraceae bacterium]|nr:phosphate butyryltransferase [Lachnospiraceae bacterium]
MAKNFEELIARVAAIPMKKVAVCVSQDSAVVEAVRAAKDRKIADAILVGDAAKTKAIADELGIDISDFEMINVEDTTEASLTAVKLVHDGKADLYMKGLIDTKGFLKSVLDKEVGLRTGKTLSHVCVFDVKGYDRLMFLTDVAFLPYPSLEDKANIIKNTVEICEACGVMNPKVAPLAAVEVVNPKMPATVDAEELHQMNLRGEIERCIVDGPLSMDLAIDPEAAKHKGATDRPVQGDADILLFPDIHTGNITYKAMVHMADCVNGNILTGTAAPVVLTSRSDTMDVKLNSLAVASLVSEYFKNN